MSREVTNKLVAMVEEGMLDWETIARAALTYMSEDEVADMANCNDFVPEDEYDMDCDDSDDGYALASAGFGMDEDY